MKKITVWDGGVRLFHFSVIFVVAFCYFSAEFRDLNLMSFHKIAGKFLLSFLIFRLLWGFFGSRTARFSDFFPPKFLELRSHIAHLFSRPSAGETIKFGHNPLGGLSVIAMIAALTTQCLSGVIGIYFGRYAKTYIDDGAHVFTKETAKSVANTAFQIHEVYFNLLLALIALHLAAILFHSFYRKEQLMKPMFAGYAIADEKTAAPAPLYGLTSARFVSCFTVATVCFLALIIFV